MNSYKFDLFEGKKKKIIVKITLGPLLNYCSVCPVHFISSLRHWINQNSYKATEKLTILGFVFIFFFFLIQEDDRSLNY